MNRRTGGIIGVIIFAVVAISYLFLSSSSESSRIESSSSNRRANNRSKKASRKSNASNNKTSSSTYARVTAQQKPQEKKRPATNKSLINNQDSMPSSEKLFESDSEEDTLFSKEDGIHNHVCWTRADSHEVSNSHQLRWQAMFNAAGDPNVKNIKINFYPNKPFKQQISSASSSSDNSDVGLVVTAILYANKFNLDTIKDKFSNSQVSQLSNGNIQIVHRASFEENSCKNFLHDLNEVTPTPLPISALLAAVDDVSGQVISEARKFILQFGSKASKKIDDINNHLNKIKQQFTQGVLSLSSKINTTHHI